MDVSSSRLAGSSQPSPVLHHRAGIYSHLDKSKSEIRLLTLSLRQTRPNCTPQLHASIETFSFDSGNLPSYLAISYEWNPPNSPSETKVLIIDGNEKQVSGNLYYALLCLGMNITCEDRFWVDALCINQEDTAERNHQVQLMRRIYGEADGVYIWLGIRWNWEAGNWAATLLREFEPRAAEELDASGTVSHLRGDKNYKTHWEAMDSVFSQSYWNRSWIIQELVAAKVALLLTDEYPSFPHDPIFMDSLMLFQRSPQMDISLYDRSTEWAANRSPTESVDETTVRRRMNAHSAVDGVSRTKVRRRREDPQ